MTFLEIMWDLFFGLLRNGIVSDSVSWFSGILDFKGCMSVYVYECEILDSVERCMYMFARESKTRR